MKYTCSICGKEHEELPAIAWSSPASYSELAEDEKSKYGVISDDYCVITYPDQTDRFIRAVLYQRVIDNCQTLDYGVWVSLSEKSFEDYKNRYDTIDNRDARYFGYLNTVPPPYEFHDGIKTDVVVSNGTNRPEIIPHQIDQMDIPLVRDYYNGINTEEALRRIAEIAD